MVREEKSDSLKMVNKNILFYHLGICLIIFGSPWTYMGHFAGVSKLFIMRAASFIRAFKWYDPKVR